MCNSLGPLTLVRPSKQYLQLSTHQQFYQTLTKESHPKFSMSSSELLRGFICKHKYADPVYTRGTSSCCHQSHLQHCKTPPEYQRMGFEPEGFWAFFRSLTSVQFIATPRFSLYLLPLYTLYYCFWKTLSPLSKHLPPHSRQAFRISCSASLKS